MPAARRPPPCVSSSLLNFISVGAALDFAVVGGERNWWIPPWLDPRLARVHFSH